MLKERERLTGQLSLRTVLNIQLTGIKITCYTGCSIKVSEMQIDGTFNRNFERCDAIYGLSSGSVFRGLVFLAFLLFGTVDRKEKKTVGSRKNAGTVLSDNICGGSTGYCVFQQRIGLPCGYEPAAF